jgi:pimeloyl-ACP methyl ester carboxylesterase
MKNKAEAKKVVSSDNTEIYYWTSWTPEMNKEFLVLHPGASMNHSSLGSLERSLNERGHPTLVFDQRGIGYSEAPADSKYYSLDRYSEDLQKMIEQEGLEKPGIITHSFGFMVAADYALKTKNIGKITGICASHNFAKTTNPVLFHSWDKALRYSSLVTWPIKALKDSIIGKEIGYSEQDLAGKSDLDVAHALGEVTYNQMRVQIKNGDQLLHWDISDKLKKLDNPLQLIYGRNDLGVRPYAGKEIAKLVKGKCDINIVEGTHTLPTTHPERVLEVLNL